MSDARFPLLRGILTDPEPFQNPQQGGPGPRALPARDPAVHAAALRAQLDAITQAIAARPPGTRIEGATREIVAVEPEPGHVLEAESLGDKRGDVQVVYQDPVTGVVLLDARDGALPHLHQKLDRYEDDEKARPDGGRAGEKAVAPIRRVREAGRADRAGPRFRAAAAPPPDVAMWLELTCRGGIHDPEGTAASRAQIEAVVVQLLGLPAPQEFVAAEAVVFYTRLTVVQVEALITATDAVLSFDLVEPTIRDWLRLADPPVAALQAFQLAAPPEGAPSVVVLDTGVATTHPMLAPAILSAHSALPGGVQDDRHGHGTQMAGLALHRHVGEAVDGNGATATHWLQSVKILEQPQQGAGSAANRTFWPKTTVDAVSLAEAPGPRERVYVLAVTADLDDPPKPTTWSQAVDQLAYNGGQGRVIVVAAGNAPVDQVAHLRGYPATSLVAKLHDPAQAANALTVGAYTIKTLLPPPMQRGPHWAMAPDGGVSPHTSGGVVGTTAIKPDIVMEGGNVAFDGQVGDPTVDTLVDMTTHFRHHLGRPLSTIFATSAATAHAGRLAAEVWAANPGLRPETVRGLLVHAAGWTPAMIAQFPAVADRLAACGYGVPDADLARRCAADRATVVIEGEIANRVVEQRPRREPPRRPTTPVTEPHEFKVVRYFRLPVPLDMLLEAAGQVTLRVTLSYFAEPSTFRRVQARGMDLRWDMQGPAESEQDFVARINKVARGDGPGPGTASFDWVVGPQRRGRGTVQSDRWAGEAALLAGTKLIAVYPVGGWWDRRQDLRHATMRFSLIVTLEGRGLPVYAPIAASLGAPPPQVVIDA